MIPGSFDYHAPATLDEAIKLLGELGEDAKILAGGHSLIHDETSACGAN